MARRHDMMRIAGMVRAARTVRRELGLEQFQKLILQAEALAKNAGLAFVFEDRQYGDSEPRDTLTMNHYGGMGWQQSDCYDEDGFINEDLGDDAELEGYDEHE